MKPIYTLIVAVLLFSLCVLEKRAFEKDATGPSLEPAMALVEEIQEPNVADSTSALRIPLLAGLF